MEHNGSERGDTLVKKERNCAEYTSEKLNRLTRIVEVSFALSSDIALEPLLQKIVDSATELTRAEFGGLLVLSNSSDKYEYFKVSGAFKPHGFPAGTGILSLPYKEGTPLMLDDIRTHPNAVGTPPGHPPVKAFIGVPLRFRNKSLGSLFVGNGPGQDKFSREDQTLLTAFASQAAIAIENTRLYKRSQQLARLKERKRIAQSLHETVAQYLFTIGLEAEKCLAQAGPCRATLALIQRLADRANEELRGAVFTLSRDTSITKESLSTLLSELIQEFENTSGVKALLIFPKVRPQVPFPVKEAVYRIVREALTNVQKHAMASAVAVTVSHEGGMLSVAIQDNGKGFQTSESSGIHFGLLTMEQLASNANGKLIIVNNDDDIGTVVRVTFPLRENKEIKEESREPDTSFGCR